MKKIKLSILSLGIFFASAAIAQDQKPQMTKEQRMEKHMDHLSSELDLSASQKEQIAILNKISYDNRQKVKHDASMDEATKKESLKKLHLEKKTEMDKILSDEQALKLKTMQAERRANHKKGDARKHSNKECHQINKEGIKKDCKMKDQKIDHKPAVK